MRIGNARSKGYDQADFTEAFAERDYQAGMAFDRLIGRVDDPAGQEIVRKVSCKGVLTPSDFLVKSLVGFGEVVVAFLIEPRPHLEGVVEPQRIGGTEAHRR